MLMKGLESQLETLKSKITLIERQLASERERIRNLQEERDEAVRAAATAVAESEGMKYENNALKLEISNLRKRPQAKPVHSQRNMTVKDRVGERVDAEKKILSSQKGRIEREHEMDKDRGFIHVSTFMIEWPDISLMKSRKCGRR